jgi:hypothetical protein
MREPDVESALTRADRVAHAASSRISYVTIQGRSSSSARVQPVTRQPSACSLKYDTSKPRRAPEWVQAADSGGRAKATSPLWQGCARPPLAVSGPARQASRSTDSPSSRRSPASGPMISRPAPVFVRSRVSPAASQDGAQKPTRSQSPSARSAARQDALRSYRAVGPSTDTAPKWRLFPEVIPSRSRTSAGGGGPLA